jgi:hypothetical protein
VLEIVTNCEGKGYCFVERNNESVSLIGRKIDTKILCSEIGQLLIEKKKKSDDGNFFYLR